MPLRAMASSRHCKHRSFCTPFLPRTPCTARSVHWFVQARRLVGGRLTVSCCQGEEQSTRRSFLSLEEAGLVEISGLSSHEKFLCRLTVINGQMHRAIHKKELLISSLNLLRVIAEQEGVGIEELHAGRVCDWFLKDKLKAEQNLDSAVLRWGDPGFEM